MNDTTKSWYLSRGVWGGAIGVIASVATLAGVNLNATIQAELVDIVVGVGGIVGGALAIYGRIKAVAAVVFTSPIPKP